MPIDYKYLEISSPACGLDCRFSFRSDYIRDYFFQVTQLDTRDRFREATIKLTVLRSNVNGPVVKISNSGHGFIYENSAVGTYVTQEATPPHTSLVISVSDSDLVSTVYGKAI